MAFFGTCLTFSKNRSGQAGATIQEPLKIAEFVTVPEENWYIVRKKNLMFLHLNSASQSYLKIARECTGILRKK